VAPIALQQGFRATYCTYFMMGFLEGPSFPATGSMLSKWIPVTAVTSCPSNHVGQLEDWLKCRRNFLRPSTMNKPGPESDDPPLNHLVVAQLSKTKLCAMFARGSCNDASCRFAHSARELRMPPDLTKTAICRGFVRGDCQDPACKFAHGESELRVTQSVYKTQLCNFYARGHCKKGHRCRHAHGAKELRSFHLEASREGLQKSGPKPLSPGRVDKGHGTPAESPSARKGEHPLTAPAVANRRFPPDAQPHAPPGLERSATSLPSSPSMKDGHGMEGHLVPGQLFEDQSPPSPHGQVVEVPMKVPLPIRPMDRSPLLPRCGPGLGPVEDFHDVPSSNLVPTPPLASWTPGLPTAPSLPNLKSLPSWRAPDMPLSQLNAEHADPVGLATAMAAAAMEHTAAASLASMHAWTWASAAVKAQMNYAASSSPWQDQGGSQYRAVDSATRISA